jgi:hypothetical protein
MERNGIACIPEGDLGSAFVAFQLTQPVVVSYSLAVPTEPNGIVETDIDRIAVVVVAFPRPGVGLGGTDPGLFRKASTPSSRGQGQYDAVTCVHGFDELSDPIPKRPTQ